MVRIYCLDGWRYGGSFAILFHFSAITPRLILSACMLSAKILRPLIKVISDFSAAQATRCLQGMLARLLCLLFIYRKSTMIYYKYISFFCSSPFILISNPLYCQLWLTVFWSLIRFPPANARISLVYKKILQSPGFGDCRKSMSQSMPAGGNASGCALPGIRIRGWG